MSYAEAWQNLLDKDDRTSPEEYPDMCLITRDELQEYMRGGFVAGMLQAVTTLRIAAGQHTASSVASRKVAACEGDKFTAAILRSYANGLEMDAEREASTNDRQPESDT